MKKIQMFNRMEKFEKFFEKKLFNDSKNTKAYIFDIDGTLALNNHRNPYNYSEAINDKVNECVLNCLNKLKENYTIIICSGREANKECYDITKKWLEKYNIFYNYLYMREDGDKRADYIVKEEMWLKICKDFYIEAMFDDRNQVVNHARNLGFNVFQVAEGDF